MAENAFPEDYRDPLYAQLDAANEAKYKLPVGLLSSVRVAGEKSNASATNSLRTKTPYQFIPATRDGLLDKHGIDVTLSPGNASEGAAILLSDSLKRNDGDAATAVREYHGGLDRSKWGPINAAYVNRVMTSTQKAKTDALGADFAKWLEANPPATIAKTAAPDQSKADALDAGFAQYLQAQQQGAGDIPGQTPGSTMIANGDPRLPAPAATGVGDAIVGAGEAALNVGTGLVGGTLGTAGGALGGLAGAVMSGQFGTPEGANNIEQAAASGAQALTYQPRTASGQAQASAVGEAIQQALPVMPLTGEMQALTRGAAPIVRQIADQTRADVAGAAQIFQAGSDAVAQRLGKAPQTPAGAAPVAPVAAPLTGEQLTKTAKTAAGGSKQATTDLAAQAAPDPKTLQAAQRLGIEDYLQPDHVTTNQAYRELAQAVKSIPGSETRAAELQGLSKVAERASKVIDDIGGTTDLSSVDQSLKGRLQASVDGLSDVADNLYAKVRNEIPLKSNAPATNVLDFVNKRAQELGGVDNLTPLEKQIARKLSPKTATSTEAIPPDPNQVGIMTGQGGTPPPRSRIVQTVRQPTYALLDDVRKDVGAATRGKGPFQDADTGLAKALYGRIEADQAAAADAHGAAQLYQAASNAVKVRKGIESDMQSLFGRALDQSVSGSLPGAVRSASQGNTAPLIGILKATPEDMRQSVVASGIATSFRTAATKGDINFGTYAKWFEGLQRNRQAFAAVMSNLPAPARRQLIDLYRVSNGISAATRERITTGRINAISEQFKVADSLTTRLYDVAKRGAVGAAAGTVLTPVLGPGVGAAVASALTKGARPQAIKAVDALISSPEFVAAVKASGTPRQAAAVTTLAHSAAFNKFVRAVGAREVGNREQWLLRAMQVAPPPQPSQSQTPMAIH